MAFHGYSIPFSGLTSNVKGLFIPYSFIEYNGEVNKLSSSSPSHYKISPTRSFLTNKGCFSHGHCHLRLRPDTSSVVKHVMSLRSYRPCKAKSENSDGTFGAENSKLGEQTLEEELQTAIAEENYTKAAKIRDTLKHMQSNGKASILMANNRFYDSFRTGDLAAMQALWAKTDETCCVHPGMRGILGYDDVVESWNYVWADYEFPLEIELKDVKVYVKGDVGFITCMEFVRTKGGRWGGQFVTNVFERTDGNWFICVHHASPVDL